MPYVWMDDVPRVQTVGANGIGVVPPIPVEVVEKISDAGREMDEVGTPANEIPNPGTVNQGATIVENNGAWSYDDTGSNSGSGSGSGSDSSGDCNLLVVHVVEDEPPGGGDDGPIFA